MFYYKTKQRFLGNKRKYCSGLPEFETKEETSDNLLIKPLLKKYILKKHFNKIIQILFEQCVEGSFFFEIVLDIDLVTLVDTDHLLGYFATKRFIEFTNLFSKTVYNLLSIFLRKYRHCVIEEYTEINFLEKILRYNYFSIVLIPLNSPIKTDSVCNLGRTSKLENNFYNVVELLDATLIRKDKKSFLHKTCYMKCCNCARSNLFEEKVVVQFNRFGGINNKRLDKKYCNLCYIKEYEEIVKKREFKNFFVLTFSFARNRSISENKDDYESIEVYFEVINEKNNANYHFQLGRKYNLVVVSLPNEINQNVKGARIGTLWLLRCTKNKTEISDNSVVTIKSSMSTLLSTECFNVLVNVQNLDDMSNIINEILNYPKNSLCLNKISRVTKLAIILICISNHFLKYLDMSSFASNIYQKIHNTNRWHNLLYKENKPIRLRPPHCFFSCSHEELMIELVDFCNFFCNIKLFNVRKDTLDILLIQKYDVLVINLYNLQPSQMKILVEMMKNGVYKKKDMSWEISTTFWIYATKSFIRTGQDFKLYMNENLLARFDFLFELTLDNDEDLIDKILESSDHVKQQKDCIYSDLNHKYFYLKKETFPYFTFDEIGELPNSLIHKYFSMVQDLSSLTVHHISICELLCKSTSILLKKNECLVEHVVLGLFLYDRFVSSTKNKLTQFDKDILNRVINVHDSEKGNFKKLMSYFASYLNATMKI